MEAGNPTAPNWNLDRIVGPTFYELELHDFVRDIWEQLDYEEFIADPRGYVNELFVRKPMMCPSLSTLNWEKEILKILNLKQCSRRLNTVAVPYVPLLNNMAEDSVSQGQVVSFRCIIQDCLGPEMCPSTVVASRGGVPVTMSTLLRDVQDDMTLEEYNESPISEREMFIGISPPGENAWIQDLCRDSESVLGIGFDEKRMKINIVKNDMSPLRLPNYGEVYPELFKNMASTRPIVSLLKIYGAKFMPNDLVEVTGIFEADEKTYNSTDNPSNSDLTLEENGFYPKIKKLPTLYVFSCIKLADGNPAVPILEGKLFPASPFGNINVPECIQTLRELTSLALGGDRYASVYVMVALAAAISLPRRDDVGGGPVGKYALNISGIQRDSAVTVAFLDLVRSLVCRTLSLEFTIDNANSWTLTPWKNIETDQLESGMLQMAAGTHVIIDETHLQEGQFDDKGVRNVGALEELLRGQIVKYDYTHQCPEIHADSPIIVLSDSPSVLPVDMRIKTNSDPTLQMRDVRCEISRIIKEKGHDLQMYLTAVRTLAASQTPLFTDDSLEDDFTGFFRSRNEEGAFVSKMSAGEFSAFLTQCRLWAILNGELSVTRPILTFWKDVERIRDERSRAAAPRQ